MSSEVETDASNYNLIYIAMARWFILISFAVSILVISCSKDELTLPAKVYFGYEFLFHQEELVMDDPATGTLKSKLPPGFHGGRLEINKGTLMIRSVEFDGRREEGRDVYFISDLRDPLIVNLETVTGNQELSFDIPQGVYNMIDIHLHPGGSTAPPLVLEGTISRGAAHVIPVRFELDIYEKLRIRAEPSGLDKIVLRKDIPSYAWIVVDAGSMFRFIHPTMFRDAILSDVDGIETLLIDSGTNQELFNALASRVEKSISIVFN
jgi:hypothetical protein